MQRWTVDGSEEGEAAASKRSSSLCNSEGQDGMGSKKSVKRAERSGDP